MKAKGFLLKKISSAVTGIWSLEKIQDLRERLKEVVWFELALIRKYKAGFLNY
jgi:hypothetical protein